MSRTPRTLWIETIRKFHGLCFFCGREAKTVDHATPRSRGGKNTADNLLPACLECNNLKDSATISEFRTYITELLARRLRSLGCLRSDPEIVFFGEGNDSPLTWNS